MTIATNSLLYFLTDALQDYTEDFRILERANPILLEMNGQRYSVHVSSIHDSGNTRDNDDEERIQIRRAVIDIQRNRSAARTVALFIGFFSDGGVFSAWEPAHVFSQNPQAGGSVYARFSHWNLARNEGGALRISRGVNLGRNVATISLRTEALGLYFENWRTFHSLDNERDVRILVGSAAGAIEAEAMPGTVEETTDLEDRRVVVTITRKAFARDPRFRDAVMRAYDGKCCICGRQLGLVQAAHIIPHAHPDCTDRIGNALALCIEHHKMYDDALLLPTADRRLHLNLDRVEHLKNIGQSAGIDEVQTLALQRYKVPEDAASHPENGLLERGARIRLGTDA